MFKDFLRTQYNEHFIFKIFSIFLIKERKVANLRNFQKIIKKQILKYIFIKWKRNSRWKVKLRFIVFPGKCEIGNLKKILIEIFLKTVPDVSNLYQIECSFKFLASFVEF